MLGTVAVDHPAESVGIALSAGRFPKKEPAFEPNEDAVMAAAGPGGSLLAVADGHFGATAAAAAIASLHGAAANLVGRHRPAGELVVTAYEIAVEGLRAALARGPATGARTALTIAAVADMTVAAVTAGDTAAVRLRGRRHRLLSGVAPFLDREAPMRPAAVVEARLQPDDRLVLLSDGVYGYLGRAWRRRVTAIAGHGDAPVAARGLVERACAAGAGDHLSTAVLVLKSL